jgi:hypothetical protein
MLIAAAPTSPSWRAMSRRSAGAGRAARRRDRHSNLRMAESKSVLFELKTIVYT